MEPSASERVASRADTVPRVARYFHTTTSDAAAAILDVGFRDGVGSYGFGTTEVRGVFVAAVPADVSDGASGDTVLEVVVPEDVDLAPYAIVEDGHAVWEWVVPAAVLNSRAVVRVLREDEADEARFGTA